MTPYKQLFRHDPGGIQGDCYRTAIGCLLDLPPAYVPHFYRNADISDAEGKRHANAWLAERGLALISLGLTLPDPLDLTFMALGSPGLYYLLSGRSRNGTNHVVVCCGGEIVHDPALDESGIVGPTDVGCYFIEIIVPSRMINR